jgi:hypothetical protein
MLVTKDWEVREWRWVLEGSWRKGIGGEVVWRSGLRRKRC